MGRGASPSQPSEGATGAWGAFGYLISGPALYGGLGWLLDRYLETSFLLPIGLLVGIALALYLVIKRFGYREPPTDS